MKPPKPETTTALLRSMGNGKVTKHVYVTTRTASVMVRHSEGQPEVEEHGWEHIFRCVKTGVTRRWGFEDHEVTN